MNQYMLCDNVICLDFPAEWIIAYRAYPYLEMLCNMVFLKVEAQRTYVTLRFPPRAKDAKGQQVQKMNYYIFIKTMADLLQKYMPKIRKEH